VIEMSVPSWRRTSRTRWFPGPGDNTDHDEGESHYREGTDEPREAGTGRSDTNGEKERWAEHEPESADNHRKTSTLALSGPGRVRRFGHRTLIFRERPKPLRSSTHGLETARTRSDPVAETGHTVAARSMAERFISKRENRQVLDEAKR
jgi:hypothetical protein